MSRPDPDIVGDVLARPCFGPLWTAARRRLEGNGLTLSGSPLQLPGLGADEVDAIAGLLGVRLPPPGGVLRVPLTALDQALRASAAGLGLLEVLGDLGGPVVDRRAGRAVDADARAARWEPLATHPVMAAMPDLTDWLDGLRASGLARRLAGDAEAEVVRMALDTLAAVAGSDGRLRLAQLAAMITGDAHGLDRGRPAGTLTVNALARLADRPHPTDAADWRRTWAEAGVACDDLSCDVLVLNLPGWPTEPLRLTLRQVSRWSAPPGAGPVVSACENPAVLAAAADHLEDRAPPMVCLDGMPSTAALVVLDGLARTGRPVRYHGDFDWRGLAIAAVLHRKVATVRPWRYTAADYERSRHLGTVPLAGRPPGSPWDPDLARAMAAAGVAVYEEQVLDLLVGDLA